MSERIISEKLFNRMRRLERRGREIATYRNVPDYMREAMEWTRELRETLSEVWESIEDLEPIEEVAKTISYIAQLEYASRFLGWRLAECQHEGIRRLGACVIDVDTAKMMKRLDEMCEDLTGERCAYFSINHVPSTICINELTACFHKLIEHLEKTVGGERVEERGDKYMIMRGAGEKERKLLKVWLDTIDKLWKEDFYSPEDWKSLKGIALKGRLGLKLGFEYDRNRAQINIEKNTIEYYDDNDAVNREMHDLLEEYAGCTCILSPFGVVCEKCNLEKAIKVLAGATSCDVRLQNLRIEGIIERRELSEEQAIEEDKRKLVRALELIEEEEVIA